MPKPLALSDSQLHAVYRAAAPLAGADRGAFLEDVARALVVLPEVGDGTVARACAEAQRRYWQPPNLSVGAAGRTSKYRWAPRDSLCLATRVVALPYSTPSTSAPRTL
jgi:hypothetical protein